MTCAECVLAEVYLFIHIAEIAHPGLWALRFWLTQMLKSTRSPGRSGVATSAPFHSAFLEALGYALGHGNPYRNRYVGPHGHIDMPWLELWLMRRTQRRTTKIGPIQGWCVPAAWRSVFATFAPFSFSRYLCCSLVLQKRACRTPKKGPIGPTKPKTAEQLESLVFHKN